MPIRIDVGDDDPFASADRAFADALTEAEADVEFVQGPGEHDEDYWWSHMDEYMTFYADALNDC
jgi:S-formylglutathione hydrolase FrmB